VIKIGSIWERVLTLDRNIHVGDIAIVTDIVGNDIKYRFMVHEGNRHLNFQRSHEEFLNIFREVKYD